MERTIVDWMFSHPFMTFVVLIVLAESIGLIGNGGQK